ncbi:MAG: SDR family NAD(P)-dependent oxidoreductase [Candidatus Krumholzibacteria bacterium]|nr:SDR family NAD(P)-dependent oxidoreductase [Candidatus Krumholzibacteria bacterium]MDH4351106.1 SDR family NAD(P)-dependent oxidoreductase [Gemmatimonadota bacterium]
MNLKGARILVTGGSLGIGKAAAQVLAQAGARVAITGRHEERLRRAAKDIGAVAIVADAGNPKDVDRTFDDVQRHLGGLDCLVNNAGIGGFAEMESVTFEEFEKVFRVNVYGAALMGARAAAMFKAQKSRGHIINIGSTAGLKGFAGGTVYAASKFALRGMTECWQAELRKHDIRVTLIAPSEVATAFGREDGKEREAAPNKLTPMEIAHAIKSVLELDDRGMIPELSVWATNPW